jgi:hypothetical protein
MAAIRKSSKRSAFRRVGGALKKAARKVFPGKKKPTGLLDIPGGTYPTVVSSQTKDTDS